MLFFAVGCLASTPNAEALHPQVSHAVAFAASERVDLTRSMWSSLSPASMLVRDASGSEGRIGGQTFASDADGRLVQFLSMPMPSPTLSFDGIANLDNGLIYNLLFMPADMNGDIGPNHYVQAVNSLIRVYNSETGEPMSPPFKYSDIFGPLGTVCSSRNDGLPIVLYDPLADRWLISQTCTAFPPFRQMVAVSKTGDPLGGYFIYEFVMPSVRLNDFPKFGIWSDGYYMSAEEYLGSDFVGSGAFAFDRKKLIAGDPSASYIYFRFPAVAAYRRSTLLPSDMDGVTPPPAGSPNIFASYSANEYGDAQDAIRLFDFHADFGIPENSTFTERSESPLAVAAFDPTSPEGRADIMQPPPGAPLDSSSDRLNYRLAYRNFGTHQTLVFNQTVRTSPGGESYRAGVRVYELRLSSGAYTVYDQTTIGDAASSRWVASTAQDRMGNLAVQYNHVADDQRVSDLYTGRLATDPPGTFRTESKIINGTGVQKAFAWRWGEYSGLSVDPVNDCDFWATNAYYSLESEQMSDFTWLTRIGRFRFDECTAAVPGLLGGNVLNAATNAPLDNAQVEIYQNGDVNAVPFTRYTRLPSGSIDEVSLPPGSYSVVATAKGFRPQSTTLDVPALPTTSSFDLRLLPVPVAEAAALSFASESCRINGSAEPGETVGIDVALRNTGAADAADLTAELLPTGGVTRPGPAQNFGTLPADGTIVARQFNFTVSPTTKCGENTVLTFRLHDGATRLEDLTILLRSGEVQYALRENFDSVTAPSLPDAWTTSSTPNHQLWRTSTARARSAQNALFTPAPIQVGENEVVSPAFHVNTPNAELTFSNWYELETTFLRNRLYDGIVLELRYGRGRWQDIVAAGGSFVTGGYDGVIDACCSNPLARREGWSGRSGINQTSEFITTKAKLPPTAAGRDVQLRWRLGSDVGGFREGMYIDNLEVSDGYSCSCASAPNTARFDIDGDGKTDLSTVRLTNDNEPDYEWIESSTGSARSALWGSAGDVPANADFDGDGRSDLAVFRSGAWYILLSSTATPVITNFGLADDLVVPSDYDGDGKADIAVFREATGVWYTLRSTSGEISAYQFGLIGDTAVPGDYDGDGKSDLAVYRPSTGTWYIARSSDGGFGIVNFGLSGDRPVPADFDGDGKSDIAVFRPSTGTWYLLRSTQGFAAVAFGVAEDIPLQADFDGDGKADIAVYRPSTRVWWHLQSSDQQAFARGFGASGSVPIPSIFVAR